MSPEIFVDFKKALDQDECAKFRVAVL